MTHQTMVFGSNMRRAERWRLYQVHTANSAYELEVQSPTEGETRRCCVLTCVAPAARAGQTFEDSSPRIAEESLFAVSPLDWIGKCLAVGTARTSEVVSVEFVSASDALAPRRGQASQSMVFGKPAAPAQPSPKPAAEPAPAWAPFPLGYVQMAEAAAGLLQLLNNRLDLKVELHDEPMLRRRLEHALSTCQLMLESMNQKR